MHKTYKTTWVFLLLAAFSFPAVVFAGQAPTVETGSAINITQKSARIDGKARAGESPDNEYWFEWSMVGSYDYAVFSGPKTKMGTWSANAPSRAVSMTLSGLAPKTQYRYRLSANNQASKVSSDWKYFTTKEVEISPEPILVVDTLNSRAVKENSAIIRGYIAPHGGKAQYWFEWGDDASMKMRTPARQSWGSGGEVEVQLSALVPGTVYFYRMVGENDRGVVHADEMLILETHGTKPPRPGSQQSTPNTSQSKPGVEYTYEHKKETRTVAARTGTGISFLDILFGGKKATSTTSTSAKDVDNAAVNAAIERGETPPNEETPTGNEIVADGDDSMGAVALAGKTEKGVSVVVNKVGDSGKHETVEYTISYRYDKDEIARDAKLIIVLPADVVYIGDTTANELLIEGTSGSKTDVKSGARTYVLPIGKLKKGNARTFSIIGMTTASAKGTPDVPVVLAYKDARGKGVAVTSAGKSSMVASIGSMFSSAGNSASKLSFLSMGSLPFVLMIIGLCIWLSMKAQKILKGLKEKAIAAGGVTVSAGKATVGAVGGAIDRASEIRAEIAARMKMRSKTEDATSDDQALPVAKVVAPVTPIVSVAADADSLGLPGMKIVTDEE